MHSESNPNLLFQKFKGKKLIDITISQVIKSNIFHKIIIESDSNKLLDYVKNKYQNLILVKRNNENIGEFVPLSKIIYSILLKNDFNKLTDYFCIIQPQCPLTDYEDIIEGYNTFLLDDTDHMISVYEDTDIHFKYGINGLNPLNPNQMNSIRIEKEVLYVFNGSIHYFNIKNISINNLFNGSIGHFIMSRNKSYQIK